MRDLDATAAAALLADVVVNLIRRGTDGSLVMSTDHWRLLALADEAFTFAAQPPAPPETEPLIVRLADVERISWDRLARQQERSQVRFRLKSGDLLTFSGRLQEPE